jgi:nitroreductase
MDVFQAMTEMRAMRRLKPDPVPRAEIEDIIRYATHAPSGGNTQGWRFVVVTDPGKRREIARLYADAVDFYFERMNTGPLPHQTREEWEKLKKSVLWARNHLAEVPVLIFPCLDNVRASFADGRWARISGSSIYPAVQNLLLACRAKGLGASLTTLHARHDAEIDALLGLPESAATFAMIPVGYPLGNFGPTRRLPVSTVIGWEGW